MPNQGNQQMNKECDQIMNFIKVKGLWEWLLIHVHSILVHELGVNYCLPFHQRRGWEAQKAYQPPREKTTKKRCSDFQPKPLKSTTANNQAKDSLAESHSEKPRSLTLALQSCKTLAPLYYGKRMEAPCSRKCHITLVPKCHSSPGHPEMAKSKPKMVPKWAKPKRLPPLLRWIWQQGKWMQTLNAK